MTGPVTAVETAPDNVAYNIGVYANLLDVPAVADPARFRRDYGTQGPKNGAGIPLVFEEQAETVGRIIASAYEEKYDKIKAEMKSRGMEFSALILDDAGRPLAVNFAAVAASPTVSRITDETDLVVYHVAAMHWLLASKDHEWVFSHLVEATGAFYRSEALRQKLAKPYANDFDDLRRMLREALRQYINRQI